MCSSDLSDPTDKVTFTAVLDELIEQELEAQQQTSASRPPPSSSAQEHRIVGKRFDCVAHRWQLYWSCGELVRGFVRKKHGSCVRVKALNGDHVAAEMVAQKLEEHIKSASDPTDKGLPLLPCFARPLRKNLKPSSRRRPADHPRTHQHKTAPEMEAVEIGTSTGRERSETAGAAAS